MDFIRIIIAILLPPLGVFLQVGFGGAFWLNILLTLCGYIPGIVHAVYIIAQALSLRRIRHRDQRLEHRRFQPACSITRR